MLLRLLKDLFRGREAPHQPETADALIRLVKLAWHRGEAQLALQYCERLRRMPGSENTADLLQSHMRFGGEPYLQVFARIVGALNPRTYVEIGIAEGNSLQLVTAPARAIGIDPEPKLPGPPAPNQKVFAETSDAFFAGHDLRAELGGEPVDLAFIDGMHHFEFALRDFANLERYCTPRSTILIHDVYPLDRATQERERQRDFWSGDIWRLVLLLKKYRPDLAVNTVATAPTGLAVVRRLDPGSRLLLERHHQLCAEFLALDYGYLEDDMPGKLNLFPNDWAQIRSLLG